MKRLKESEIDRLIDREADFKAKILGSSTFSAKYFKLLFTRCINTRGAKEIGMFLKGEREARERDRP